MPLYAYKLTHDSGFAPNPFWGFLTLATCKPGVRRTKRVGDWVAGFSSSTLNGDRPGEESLVYLMEVGEKLTIADYFRDSRFKNKIPVIGDKRELIRCGDNIYRPRQRGASEPKDFEQLENPHHWDGKSSCGVGESRKRDVSGMFVLVATRFAYFGSKPLRIPAGTRPNVPYGMSPNGSLTAEAGVTDAFIQYVFEYAQNRKVLAQPHSWPDCDESWRETG